MSKKMFVVLIIVLSVCLSLVACDDSSNLPPNNPSDKNPVIPELIYWGKLSGVVTENDKPCQGVKVSSGNKTTVTDSNGKYTIDVYDDGAKVEFTKDGYITQTNTFKSSSFNSEICTYCFNIFRDVKVVGKVVDANGTPVSGAKVTIGIRSVDTDMDGRFVMDNVIGTSMLVFAEKDEHKVQKPIFSEEMQSGTVEIELILR